jgi:hypothetical protein
VNANIMFFTMQMELRLRCLELTKHTGGKRLDFILVRVETETAPHDIKVKIKRIVAIATTKS